MQCCAAQLCCVGCDVLVCRPQQLLCRGHVRCGALKWCWQQRSALACMSGGALWCSTTAALIVHVLHVTTQQCRMVVVRCCAMPARKLPGSYIAAVCSQSLPPPLCMMLQLISGVPRTLVLALLRIAGGYCLSSTSPVCRWPGSNSWAATLLQNETVLAGQGQADSADIQALSFILRFHPSSSGYQDLPAIVSTSPSIAVQHQQHQLFVTATSTPYRFCNFQKAEQHQV